MAINNQKIREKLAKLQTKGGNFEKTDFKALFFKPQLGKQTLRIVPNKFDPEIPYKEVVVHSFNAFRKTLYALSNWGEKDPILVMRKKLFEDKDDESTEIAKKLSPRTRYFFYVIVRGQEENGVRLWEVGKQTVEKILTIMNDDDYGDITDIVEGFDITVEGYEAALELGKGKKKTYIDVNITPKRKESPLSDDPAQVKAWLENQKDPLEIQKKYTYDELKQILNDFLFPEDKGDDDDDTPVKNTKAKEIVKGAVAKAKAKVEDDEDEDEEEEKPVVKAKAKKAPVVEDDEDEEEEAPAPKAKAKTKAKPVVVDDEDDEEEDTPPVPKKIPAKKKPVVDLLDDDDDSAPIDADEEDTVPAKKQTKLDVVVKGGKTPAKTSTAAKRFAEMFEDED